MEYNVIGGLFGNEGKGSVIQWLCKNALDSGKKVVVTCADSEIEGHTVRYNGIEHTFKFFGSGTLVGAKTNYKNGFYIDPVLMYEELQQLIRVGITPNFRLFNGLYCHGRLITPYDKANGDGLTAAKNRYDYNFISIRNNPIECLNTAKNYYKSHSVKPDQICEYLTACEKLSIFNNEADNDSSSSDTYLNIYSNSNGILTDREYSFLELDSSLKCGISYKDITTFIVFSLEMTSNIGYRFRYPIKHNSGIFDIDLITRALDRIRVEKLTEKNIVFTHVDKYSPGNVFEYVEGGDIKHIKVNSREDLVDFIYNKIPFTFDKVYWSDNPDSNIYMLS